MNRAEIIDFLEAAIAEATVTVGPHTYEDRTWHARRTAATTAIGEQLKARFGARIRDDWNGARLAMAGVTCTCTAGLSGAFTNWISAARRKEAAS